MNHLIRELAPVPSTAWEQIDEEAGRTLRHFLTARRLVDVNGPHGWAEASVTRGRAEDVGDAPAGIQGRVRNVQPLLEYRAEFWLERAELDAIDRGALDADLDPVRDAARRLALAEDAAVFHGHPDGGIQGIAPSSPHEKIQISDEYRNYPGWVARAVAMLQTSGIAGPVRRRARPALLHRRHRDHGDGRLSRPRTPPTRCRRTRALGAGSRRRGRPLDPQRRLRAHTRAGRLDRLPRSRRDVGAPLPRGIIHLHRDDPRSRRAPGVFLTILVDAPRWARKPDDQRFAHLVSDTAHAEVHTFVAALRLPRPLRFHDDHYDIPEQWWGVAVDHGAQVVTTRELVRRLRAAGLRRTR